MTRHPVIHSTHPEDLIVCTDMECTHTCKSCENYFAGELFGHRCTRGKFCIRLHPLTSSPDTLYCRAKAAVKGHRQSFANFVTRIKERIHK